MSDNWRGNFGGTGSSRGGGSSIVAVAIALMLSGFLAIMSSASEQRRSYFIQALTKLYVTRLPAQSPSLCIDETNANGLSYPGYQTF